MSSKTASGNGAAALQRQSFGPLAVAEKSQHLARRRLRHVTAVLTDAAMTLIAVLFGVSFLFGLMQH